MTFSAIFPRVFQPVFGPGLAADDAWWLSGGVAAADCVAAYQPKGAASLAASYVNLANPGTYDAAPGVAPTFDAATGWTFNGTNQYLTTNVTASNGWSTIVRWAIPSRDATNRGIVGSRETSTSRFAIATPWITTAVFYQYGATTVNPTRNVLSGVDAITQDAYYADGSGTSWTPSGTWTAGVYEIGRVSATGTLFLGNIQAVAIYKATLTAPQVALISAAMAAL